MYSTLPHNLRLVSFAVGRHTASVALREQLALLDTGWDETLRRALPGLQEWALVQTCHRLEIYIIVEVAQGEAAEGHFPQSRTNGHILPAESRIQQLLIQQLTEAIKSSSSDMSEETRETGRQSPPLESALVWRWDRDAAEHLCVVAAGLDSAILGEAQILGQVTQAFTDGVEAGHLGLVLTTLFRTAIRAGKRARTETAISAHASSMSSVALSMVSNVVGDLAQKQIVVIGAGEMSQLALKALRSRQISSVVVANRTMERADAALMDRRWQAITLEDLPAALAQADIIFSATSAPAYILTAQQITQLLDRRAAELPSDRQRNPLALIDLAVPRDIDPAVRTMEGVALIDVDDLQGNVEQNHALRSQAEPAVREIIGEELEQWLRTARELALRPIVAELRQRAEEIRQQEVARTMRFLGTVDQDTEKHIQHLSRALVNKLLHTPTVRIKELAQDDNADHFADTVRDLFGLEETE